MSEKTVDLDRAMKRGLNKILDNVEVTATITIRDKDGNFKRNLTATRIKNDATLDDTEKHSR